MITYRRIPGLVAPLSLALWLPVAMAAEDALQDQLLRCAALPAESERVKCYDDLVERGAAASEAGAAGGREETGAADDTPPQPEAGVEPEPPQTAEITDDVGREQIEPAGDKNTSKRIASAIESIEDSLNPEWWIDDQTITRKRVFDEERAAIAQLNLVVASGVTEADAAQDAIDVLLNADRQLARIATIAATNADGHLSLLLEAEVAMAEAQAYIDAGLYVDAVNAYKRAWNLATNA